MKNGLDRRSGTSLILELDTRMKNEVRHHNAWTERKKKTMLLKLLFSCSFILEDTSFLFLTLHYFLRCSLFLVLSVTLDFHSSCLDAGWSRTTLLLLSLLSKSRNVMMNIISC
jgi:hypothetical protein